MLDEQIFDEILKLSKEGFVVTVSYEKDKDWFKLEMKKWFNWAWATNGFVFTPQFYSDAVASRLFLLEKIKKMAIEMDEYGKTEFEP